MFEQLMSVFCQLYALHHCGIASFVAMKEPIYIGSKVTLVLGFEYQNGECHEIAYYLPHKRKKFILKGKS